MSKADDARQEAEAAKQRLQRHFGDLKGRTRPQALMGTVKQTAKKRALQAGIAALANARVRPVVAAGVAVGALAYLFRNPILNALRKRAGKGDPHD